MYKVSIIVPVYNKAQYLRECLNSLVNQTLKDIEIICIDDKSTDESLNILFEYKEKDERIKIITNDINKGVSASRNIGIKNASGEFIAFVDADDFVELDFYEKLYKASEGYECVKGEIWDYDTDINNCVINDTYDLNEEIIKYDNPIYFFVGFTSAIYRKTFIDKYKICFPEGISYFEDPLFSIMVATRLSKIQVANDAKYFYRTVRDGLSRNVDEKKIEDFYKVINNIFSYLESCNLDYDNKYIIVNNLFPSINSFFYNDKMYTEKRINVKRLILNFLKKDIVDNRIKISIVVPVYNGEKYLYRALDSIIFQSLKEIEIICVNDASTDNSLSILKEYENEDARIKIINCDINGGESKARNIGLNAAKGEYIAYVDQDDKVDLQFYEKLYNKAIDTNADICKGEVMECNYYYRWTKRKNLLINNNPLYFSGDWWTAIYKKSLIINNKIRFIEKIPLGGDLKFLFDACSVCNKASIVEGVYYYHIMHKDSGDSSITTLNKMKSVIYIFTYILNRIEKMNLIDKDIDIYVYYYYYYIYHTSCRIRKCENVEAKLLCIDFIFENYNNCKAKEIVIEKISKLDSFFASCLRNNKKDFYSKAIISETLSNIYYNETISKCNNSVSFSIIVPYIDKSELQKFVINNPFLLNEKNIHYNYINNTIENKPISVRYNEFLDNYDFNMDTWFIFMHSDFEFLSFPSCILNNLDKNKIYGPIGVKIYKHKDKIYNVIKGKMLENNYKNKLSHNLNYKFNDLNLDTLDCVCMIIHSSLVRRYNLRFDENFLFDLYVEDFCINAKKKFNIDTEVVYFDCAHYSIAVSEIYYTNRYLKQLKYINQKYPNDIYGGTVSLIGGKLLPKMSDKEFTIFRIRYETKTGKKL